MKLDKILIILLIILLTCIGGVYAADSNQTTDAQDDAGDVLTSVEVDVPNEDDSVDNVVVESDSEQSYSSYDVEKTNISNENSTDDFVQIKSNLASKSKDVLGVSNESEILKATDGKDVLGVTVSGNFANLVIVIQNSDEDVYLVGDVRANLGGNTDVEIRRSSFTIYGNNYTMSPFAITHIGNSKNRIFSIQSGQHDITFDHIHFEDGADDGSAVYIDANCKNIKFLGCEFEGSNNGFNSVYLSNNCENITFINCIFKNRYKSATALSSSVSTGAVYIFGNCHDVSFTGCTFSNNKGPDGGAIYIGGDCYNFNFDNCQFSSNVATTSGGAVYIGANGHNMTFSNIVLSENSASSNAGAVYISTGVHDLLFDQFQLLKNYATDNGGAVYINQNSYDITFSQSVFSDNNASGTSRGILTAATPGIGGALYITDACNNITFSKSNFTNNKANSPGRAAGANGGALFVAGTSNVNLDGCTLMSNTAYSSGGAISTQSARINMIGSTFTSNAATNNYGGAVYFASASNYFNVSGSSFTGNEAQSGGAFYFAGTVNNQNITDSVFTTNNAISGNGGAILYAGSVDSLTIGSTFTANTATSNGQSIMFSSNSGNVKFNHADVNTHSSQYGAVYFAGNIETLNILNSEFYNNNVTAATSSGPFYFANANTVNVNNSIFKKNKAPNGAALYLPNTVSSVNIDKSTFESNAATSNGGAIYSNSNLTVTDSKLNSNNAVRGGAIYLNSADNSVSASFTDNAATGEGGAIYVNAKNTISQSNFTSNTAQTNGNAIYVANGDASTISNSNFDGDKHVYINSGAVATLNENNEINAKTNEFSVNNLGTLSLSGNKFNSVIINRGLITSPVSVNLSGNKTYTFDGFEFPLNASVLDDKGNVIVSYALKYNVTPYYAENNFNDNLEASDDELHENTLITSNSYYLVNMTDSGLAQPTVYISIINVITRVGTYTWLQENIDNLTGDVLDLTENVTFDSYYDLFRYNHYVLSGVNFTNGMLYNKSITLQGNGNTISGDNQARIFQISVSDVTIDNVKFVNASSKQKGGAFFINKGLTNINIKNSKFEDNTAGAEGGAVYWAGNGENILISNSVFNRNSAYGGGAIQFYANSDETYNHIEIINCNFTNNKDLANNDWGGSAIGINQATDVDITECVFDANNATSYGALMIDYCDDFRITSTNFTNNFASKSAGAIFLKRPKSVKQDIIIIEDSLLENNSATQYGGAIYAENGFSGLTSVNSKYINNSAASGGAINSQSMQYVQIIDSSFNQNKARNGAGAIYIGGTDNLISGCNFTENTATNYGAVYASGDNMITQSTFTGNNASGEVGALYYAPTFKNEVISGNKFINNHAFTTGAFRFVCNYQDENIAISEFVFENNTADDWYGAMDSNQKNGIIKNSNFTGNKASYVSALYVDQEGNKILNCIFEDNEASVDYGAVYLNGMHDFVSHSTFNNNKGISGSAIYSPLNNVTVEYSNFTGNYARDEGAAIYAHAVDAKITNCNFTVNNATNGGAIYSESNGLLVNNSAFTGNRATNGGAIYCLADGNLIANSIFTKNYASDGAAVYLTDDTNVINCLFEDNVASGNGVFYMNHADDKCTVKDSTFIRNHASNGGAIYYDYVAWYPNLYIENDTFINNTASHNGGAVYYQFNNFYRDYNDFDGSATPVGDRTNVNFKSDNSQSATTFEKIIFTSYFEGNEDYLFELKAYAEGTVGIVEVHVPKDANERSSVVVINLTDENGTVTTVIVNNINFVSHFNAERGIFSVNFYNLTENSTYNVSVSFHDNVYKLKNMTGNFTTESTQRGDFEILQGLIDEAILNGGELNLTRNYEFREGLDTGEMHIDAPIKINGNGYSINALGHCRIFNITGADVTLNYITFIEGNAGGDNGTGNKYGGAIYWDGPNGTAIRSLFYNNTADYGGAIYFTNNAPNSRISNATFELNNATYNGGAIDCNASKMNLTHTVFESNYGEYGAALCRESQATRGFGYNNTFIGNVASKAGAALGWIQAQRISIDTYFFYNNTALESGGAIYVGEGSEDCEIYNCIFDGNNVTGEKGMGGAIGSIATHMVIENTTLSNNNAYEGGAMYVGSESGHVDATNVTFINNTAKRDGGAIDLESSSITLKISNFYNNTAGANGGAINLDGVDIVSNIYEVLFEGNNATAGNGGAINCIASIENIRDSTFTNNNAGLHGGAVFVGGNSTGSQIANSTFEYNRAERNGGAIDWNASKGALKDSIFNYNTADYGGAVFVGSNATYGVIYNVTFVGNNATHNGGAVDWNASSGDINESRFINNSALANGGAVFVGASGTTGYIINSNFTGNNATNRGGAVDWYASGGHVIGSRFEDNSADYGGAIFVGRASGSGSVYNSTFIRNHADENGGAVDWNASRGNVTGSSFYYNTANYGGAIFVGSNATNGTIYNATFVGNNATHNGGAVDWNASSGNVNKSRFIDNTAGANGGAVFVGARGTTGYIINSNFTGNNATGRGGAVDWYASGGNVIESRFENNNAHDGGALFVGRASGNGNVVNSTFIDNSAKGNGGAIDWNATGGHVENSVFERNEADFGGAIFVGNSTSNGYIINSNFTENIARHNGGAIDWNASNGHVKDSTFERNEADFGGAIFVGTSSEKGSIVNSTFNYNTAKSNGGAVDWNATNGNLSGSRFTGNNATCGGAVFVGGNTTDGYIINSNFTLNTATRGGAIDWNASGGDIIGSRFIQNSAADGGAVFVGHGAEYGNITNSAFEKNHADNNGGAIYFNNIKDGDIINDTFDQNTASYGGAVFVNDCPDMKILYSNFTKNIADEKGGAIMYNNTDSSLINNAKFESNNAGEGGAIYLAESDDVNLTSSKFDKNGATLHAADICVDKSTGVWLYNLTISNSDSIEPVYVDANATLENLTINNWAGNAIVFNGGKSSLINSTLTGENAILINEDANVTLIKNSVEGMGDYTVFNNGILTLANNTFENVIINNGTILSKTYTVILNNSILTVRFGEDAVFNATIEDDNKNTIVCVSSFKFLANETPVDSTYEGKYQKGIFKNPDQGIYIITAGSDIGLMDNEVKNATLIVKVDTAIEVAVTEQVNEGEKVVIVAVLYPGTATGNVTFYVNGVKYIQPIDSDNAMATLTLNNLSATYYTVTAVYDGDELHFGCENQTNFTVNMRDPTFKVEVANILTGQNATVVVTTNATGTVLIIVNGKVKEVEIKDGKAEWNVSDLEAGSYTASAMFFGNNQFNRASANDTFNVSDMSVSVDDVEYGNAATIVIAIPEDVHDGLTVYVDGEKCDDITYNAGNATVMTKTDLSVGTHTVNVTYTGDAYAYNEINGTSFNVTASSDYKFELNVTPAEYGKNTTIEVEVSEGISEVNVTVDGEDYTVKINETTHKGTLTLNNLTAGDHEVVARFNGTDTLAAKEITEKFTINKTTSDLNVSVINNGPGKNSTVIVKVGPNATGSAVVTINGQQTFVDLDENGNAVVNITDAQPGNYSVTAKYLGDDNYERTDSAEAYNFTIDKFDATVEIDDVEIDENNNVTVKVNVKPSNATGNVTVTLTNGSTFTAPVENGVAIVNVGVLPVGENTAYNVTYSGDKNYNSTTIKSTDNITVGKLNNLTAEIDVTAGQYGENTTVEVKVPSDVDGNVTVVLDDGTEYPAEFKDGVYVAEIPSTVGDHNITVKVENSSKYNDKEFNESFTVDKNSNYDLDVNVTVGNYSQNTTIEVTAPKDIAQVNLTIDGANYTVNINQTTGKGVFTIDNLTAGKHEVVVSYSGDDNYEPESTSQVIDIPKAVSDMNVTVSEGVADDNITVKVNVGPNATGIVIVNINDEKHYVDVDENGTATYIIENIRPGEYNITAEFTGDDNYAKSTSNKTNFTIDKVDATISIGEPIIDDNNNVTVVVEIDPKDVTGNVTVTLANGTNVTVPVKDGKAEVNIGVLPVGEDTGFNVTYSGDDKYANKTVKSDNNITVGKLNNLTAEINVVPGQYGENTTVEVKVPADFGEGDVVVVLENGDEYAAELKDGVYVVEIPTVVGNNNITVKVENSSKYNNKEFNESFTVDKNDKYDVNITITPSPAEFGENVTIEVEIPEGMDNVTVIIDGEEHVVPVDNTTGKGKFEIDNLTAGNHTITVVTPGNENYSSVVNTTELTVEKAVSNLTINISDVAPGEDVNVTVDVGPNATGYVVVTVNGEEHVVPVNENGTATYVIPNAQPGDLNITAEFLGDDNYEAVKNSKNTTVDKFPSDVEIDDIVIDDNNNVTVVVEITPKDATGNVTVTLANGTNVTVPVKDGKAEVNVGVLPVGEDTGFNVTYSGDDKYANKTVKSDNNITVGKLNNLTAEINVVPGQYGENTTVEVKVPADMDGNVTVVLDDGTEYPAEFKDGVYVAEIPSTVGDHNITVKVENSSKYNNKEFNESFTVDKNSNYDLNVDVTVGNYSQNTTIEVTAPKDIAQVNLTIDGGNYIVNINQTTGKGVFTIDNLTAGKHEVVVSYAGDDNYDDKTTSEVIDIPKAVSDMNITVTGGEAGDNITVKVDVGPNATGIVIINVNDEKHYIDVDENGTAIYVIENIQPGEYNITANFTGDDNYAKASNKTNFTIDKLDAEIVIGEVIVDENNNVTVVVEINPKDATGNVTVTLANGTNITVPIEDGKAEIPVGVLPVNTTMAYNVTYTGDDRYNKTTKVSDENITAGKLDNLTAEINVVPGQYGENTTVEVKVPSDVDGNVTVVLDDGSEYPAEFKDGVYVVEIPTVVGNNNITVKVENSSKYNNKEFNESFTVDKNDKYDVNITITPSPAEFGENVTIEVEIPEGMDNVTVIIDGEEHVVPVDNTTGKGKFEIDNLTAGNHTITVVTPGNENYSSVVNTTELTVEKAVSNLTINISDVAPGEDVNVTVDVGPNATGYVVVTVNGEEHVVPVDENGTATYVIPNAQPGDLNITAEFLGDDNYEAVKNSKNTTVDKFPSDINVGDIVIDDNNNVTVVVEITPKDATGNVTVTLANGTNVTVPVKDGKAEVNVGVLPVGENTGFNVTYSGDDKYAGTTETSDKNITVGKLNNLTSEIEVIPGKPGENTTIKITVPEDADGNITVIVDGEEYPVTKDENGTYIAEVPADVGDHNITVKVENSTKYTDTEFNDTYTVGKNDDYNINVTVSEGKYGETTTIDVEVPKGIAEVNLTIDGENYTVYINETTGKGTFAIDNLTAGKHEVVVSYPGDDNYGPESTTKVIDIPKAVSDMEISASEAKPGENVTVKVDVGPNATGIVVVNVNGEKHYVDVENGTATYTIENIQPGEYNITAEFTGDDNYAKATSNKINFTVEKFESEIIIEEPVIDDNNNVTIIVKVNPSNATGNVTVTLPNGTNITVPIEDGVAEVNIGVLPVNTTTDYNVTYSGDENYNGTTKVSEDNITVGKLNNLTADIEVIPGDIGENTTVKVTVPEDADGNVTIEVDGKEYDVTLIDGSYVAEVPTTVGIHNVTVKVENSSLYADKEFKDNYTIKKDDSNYTLDVKVTPGSYGENTTIEIKTPKGISEVTVSIDGENHTVSINETTGKGVFTIDNLTAGKHEVVTSYAGDLNYTAKSTTNIIDIPKAVSDMEIEVTGGEPGKNVTVKVDVGPNATGIVIFNVNGDKHYVDVENGTATYTIENAKPGEYNITAEFTGDDNYAKASNKTNITVKKFNSTIEILDPVITDDNNVTIIVKVTPENATGNVTVTLLNGTNITVPVENGTAEINIGTVDPNTDPIINVTYSGDDENEPVNLTSDNSIHVGPLNNLTAEIEVIPGQYGENTTVKVTLPEDARGNITLTVDDVEYPVTKDENGTYIAEIPATVGNHTVKVSYTNDTRYNDTEFIETYEVEPNDKYDVKINVTEGEFGEDTIIEVEVPEGMDNVTIIIDGEEHIVHVDNITGKGKLVIDNLTAGNHTIEVVTPGNEKYTSKTNKTTVDIPKAVSDLEIEISEIAPGENVTVKVNVGPNATGPVVISVNGVEHVVVLDENGTATYTIENVQPGDLNITAEYYGDSNYEPVKNTRNETVDKFTSDISVDEPVISDSNNVTVVVNVEPEDATGTVTVTLANGTNFTAPVKDGKAEVNIGVLPVGENTGFNVTYSGDDIHSGKTVESDKNITVGKLNNLTSEIEVIPGKPGENITIKVTVPEDADGNITVIVDGEEYPVTKDENGTYIAEVPADVGDHNITVKVENSTKYADTDFNDTYTVGKNDDYDLNVTVSEGKYGENTTIEVTVPAGIAQVNLTIDGENYTVDINETTGKGTFTIDNLTAGKHEVVVSYPGDDDYGPESTTKVIDIPKAVSDMEISVSEAKPGENVTVKVNVGESATGIVVIEINDEKHYVDVENGTATYVIENIQPGEYNITANFSGDDNYAKASNKTSFTVEKYEAEIIIEDPIVDDNNNVTIVVKITPENATGNVTVSLANGTNITVPVENGTAVVPVGVLPVNETMPYNVTYSGDDNVNGTSKVADENITVGKLNNFTANIEVIPGQYGENTTVKVTVPEDATGNITVTVDGEEYPVTKDDNETYVAEIPSTVGNHTVEVSYTNDTKYEDKQFNETFNVDPNDKYDVKINVTEGEFGQNTTVEVEVPEGMDNVTIIIDGEEHIVPVDNTTGKGKLVIDNLTAGNHTIEVVTPGNENYTSKSNSTTVNVEPAEPAINVEVIPAMVGETAKVNITLPTDATGSIVVDVNGTKYYQDVVNGSAIVEIPDLPSGDYVVNVTYMGDENYEPVSVADELSISKNPVDMNVSVSNSTAGENTIVDVELPEDVYGTVTVQIGNITKTVAVAGGENEIIIPDVPAGDYDVVVTFNGNDKYEPVTETVKLNVSSKEPTADDFEINDTGNGTVEIIVPENATGDITVLIDGEEYPAVVDENGTITIPLENLTPGKHNITVKYVDENGNESVVNSTITVPKWDSSIKANAPTIREGDEAVITVEVDPRDATGFVHIDVNGVGYYANVTDGIATLKVNDLVEGTYDIKVSYLGDDKYVEANTTTTLVVQKAIGVNVEDDGNITIDVPQNTTGSVEVLIDGEKYANVSDVNGTIDIPLENVTPGEHNLTVIYTDADGGNSTVEKTITVPKWDSNIKVDAPSIVEGDDAVITVEIDPTEATGYVHVDIDGIGYYANVTDGVAKVIMPALKAGTHSVTVTYMGDEKYDNKTVTADLVVQEKITIDVTGDDSIEITLPENGTGNVTVEIDGVPQDVTVKDGKAIVNTSDLAPGTHNVDVTYTDDEGTVTHVNDTIEIPKKDADMKVDMKYDPDNNREVIDVTLPEDAKGVVLLDVDGKGYYVNVTDGKAQFNIDDLPEGDYDIKVTYVGDDKYNNESVSDNFTISKKKSIATEIIVDAKFSRVANDYDAGERGTMFYAVLQDTDGNVLPNKVVQIAVNGPIYNVTTDDQGRAGLNVNLANANTYTYALFFQGDDLYNASHIASTKLTVTKKTTSITASAKTFKASAKTKSISVTLKTSKNPYNGKTYLSAGKKITMTLAGKTYTAKTNSKGVAKFNIKLTKKGSYTAKITFAGDKTYDASGKSIKVTIK